MSREFCIYHSADFDGICCGAIFHRRFPDAELFGYDYGKPFPWDEVKDRDVYMADVSLPIGDMFRLREEAKSFTWVNHHKSIIEDAEAANFETPRSLFIGKAACELLWEYLYPNEEIPLAVQLLGRYDVWDHSDSRTLLFQYGLRALDVRDPSLFFWKQLVYTGTSLIEVPDIIDKGETILGYISRDNSSYVSAASFEAEFHGLHVIACNRGLGNSQLFDSVWDESKYDAMVVFYLNKRRQWRVSLYTTRDDVDVSLVAKKLGGGGHQRAAGFVTNSCPF